MGAMHLRAWWKRDRECRREMRVTVGAPELEARTGDQVPDQTEVYCYQSGRGRPCVVSRIRYRDFDMRLVECYVSQVDRKVGCRFVDVNVSVVQSIPSPGQALDELRFYLNNSPATAESSDLD